MTLEEVRLAIDEALDPLKLRVADLENEFESLYTAVTAIGEAVLRLDDRLKRLEGKP